MSNKENSNKFNNTLKIVYWICKLIYGLFPRLIIYILLIQIFNTVLPYIQNRFLSQLIDNLISFSQNGSTAWISTFVVFIIIRSINSIAGYFDRLTQRILNFHIDSDLKKIYINKISTLDFQLLENKDTASLISKVNEEYGWRTRQIFLDIVFLFSQIVGLITVLVILVPRYWLLAVLIFLGEIPGFLVDKKWTLLDWKLFNTSADNNKVGWDLHYQLTSKAHLIELKINNTLNYLQQKYGKIVDEFSHGRIKLRLDKTPYQIFASLVSNLAIAICLLFIVKDIRDQVLTVGIFTFYFNTIRSAGDTFGGLINSYISISEQSLHIGNFKKVMELNNIIVNGRIKSGLESSPEIEFRHVYFKYPNSDRYVFQDLNLTIHPNEEIAIIGVNGAGKSTLIKLLCRLYDTERGEILLNGINIKDYDVNYWYQHIAILFQEFNVYQNLSLKENVMIGCLDKNKDEDVIESLKKSDGYKFTQKYKNGLQTMMSQRFGGEEPSWGQWQKIAIARIFHRDTPVMILDEPTASIDANSEYKIFNHLYRETTNKTVIIVSHRFSTVRNAQRIIVISKGKIIEQGSHDELLKLNGFYKKSFNLQAEGYQ
jgi:ABC-type multidrug transport system fused ATPase/permease subunit